jgi:hypothetical protein
MRSLRPGSDRPKLVEVGAVVPWHRRAGLLAVIWVVGLGMALAACDDDDASGFPTMGMPGIPSPTKLGANLIFADVALDGRPGGRLGVDTGSPVVLIDPTKFPGAAVPNQVQLTGSLTFGDFTVDNIPMIQIRTSGAMDPLAFAGLLGGNVMRQFSVQFNYADPARAFRLGMPPMDTSPPGVEIPGASVGFVLEGGGRGQIQGEVVNIVPTRIPVTVDIDGVPRPFILDTGASETSVRSVVYSAIVADGRPQLYGLPISTVAGPAMASVTRSRTMTVAGQMVANAAVMTIGDTILDSIQQEVKHPVDGLLGGNYLREFLVTIDYPLTTMRLQRYDTPPVADEFKRIGIELGAGTASARFSVGVVYAGTDAELKQLKAGDELMAIDGQALNSLDSLGADALLTGTVGSTRQVQLGAAAAPGLSDTTITVLVEDLIPPPPPAP